jgi:hypothetical protein
MKSLGWLIVPCTAILFMGLPLAAQSPSILEPKFERRQGPPVWVSAETAADAEKIINLDLIDNFHLRKSVEEQRLSLGDHILSKYSKAGEKPPIASIPPSECRSDTLSMEIRGGDQPSATLSDLATYSQSIVRGTIRTIEPGFAFGEPSSLLGVEVSEVVKGAGPKSTFYIDYPVARFTIGPFFFCNAEKGFEPSPGDEILLFDYVGSVDRDSVLYAPRLDQLFFQRYNGGLFLPPRLKSTPGLKTLRTLDEITNRLRSPASLPDSKGEAQ